MTSYTNCISSVLCLTIDSKCSFEIFKSNWISCSSTELVLQNLAFDETANEILPKLLEGLFFSIQLKSALQINNWVETVAEAYFLQNSLFTT